MAATLSSGSSALVFHNNPTLALKTLYPPILCCFLLVSAYDELACSAHFAVLEITSRNQGSELSSATMILQWRGSGPDT